MRYIIFIFFLTISITIFSNSAKKELNLLLKEIKTVTLEGKTPFIIIDIEGTILEESDQKIYKVIDKWCKKKSKKFCKKILKIENLTKNNMKSLLYPDIIKTEKGIVEFEDFINENYNNLEYFQTNIPKKGSIYFINKLYDNGAEIIYFSENSDKILPALNIWLLTNGFPIGKISTTLVIKDLSKIDNGEFKKINIGKIVPKGRIIAIFDNDPKVLDKISIFKTKRFSINNKKSNLKGVIDLKNFITN